jgi:hypothetical protein
VTLRSPALTGGCQCGAVRYAIYAMPEGFSICHCRMCQKAVGGPFAAYVPNKAADFDWTRGTPGMFASSSIATRGFCRDCGTPLSFLGPSGRMNVTLGSLDDPSRVELTEQFGMEGKHSCIDKLPEMPGTEGWQDKTPATMPVIINHQHPDHETPGGWRAATGSP